jgi:hypothetical protein
LETFTWKRQSFTNRDLALIAGVGAVAIVYGYFASVSFRTVTRSTDVFFLMATAFTILKCTTGKHWTATLLALVASPVYLLTSAPFPIHIPIALVVNGFIFDLYLRLGQEKTRYARNHLVVAGAIGSFVMAAITLTVLTVFGIPIPPFVLPIALITDTFAGVIGVLLGIVIARRVSAEYAPLKTVKIKKTISIGAS